MELIERNIEQHETTLIERDGNQFISGYASVYYSPNDAGSEYHLGGNRYERIKRGAFDKCIAERQNVELRYNHSNECVLDTIETGLILRSDDKGLYYEDAYKPDDPDHQKVASKIKRKLIKGSSFGAIPKTLRWTQEGDKHICNITEFEVLRDVSPVNNPAYKSSVATISRSHEESYELWLKAKAETDKRLKKCELPK